MRPFFFISVLTVFIAANASAAEDAILPAARKAAAVQRQESARLAVQHQQQHCVTLRELNTAGLASFLELALAQNQLQRLQAERLAADEYSEFLNRIDVELQNTDAAKTSSLLLTVPGLLKSPVLRQLAVIRVTSTPELREIMQRPIDRSESPQLTARTELLDRLRQTELADTAANVELSVAKRKRELTALRPSKVRLLTDCLEFEGLHLLGNTVANSLELNVLLERRFGESQLRALQRAVAADVDSLNQRRTRLQKIPADARMPAESIELQWHHDAATRQLTQIDTQLQQLALLANARTNWRPASAGSALPAALSALLEHRLEAARFDVEQQQQRLQSLHISVGKVAHLAAKDRFFAGEAARLELDRELLRAQAKAAEDRFELTRLENELAAVMLAGEDATAAAAEVFEAMAESPHQLAVANAQEELTSWKRDAVQQLFDDGHASWMECRAATVRHEEAVTAVAEIVQEQEDYRTIAVALRKMSAVNVANNSN